MLWLCMTPFLPQALQQQPHIGDHGHTTNFAVLGSCLRVATHNDFAFVKITICPGDVRCFVLTKSSVGGELDQVGTGQTRTVGHAANLLHKRMKLIL